MRALAGELVYLGLGSNLQEPARQIENARRHLHAVAGLRPLGFSDCYRSAPWGNRAQPDFVNAVAAFDCSLAPGVLLELILAIERAMGRTRTAARWTPRSIDLDMLFFGARNIDTPQLTLPHPHARERAFVLVPLVELAAKLADSRLPSWQADLSILPRDDVVRLQPESVPPDMP